MILVWVSFLHRYKNVSVALHLMSQWCFNEIRVTWKTGFDGFRWKNRSIFQIFARNPRNMQYWWFGLFCFRFSFFYYWLWNKMTIITYTGIFKYIVEIFLEKEQKKKKKKKILRWQQFPLYPYLWRPTIPLPQGRPERMIPQLAAVIWWQI